jgi:hypothetical protein
VQFEDYHCGLNPLSRAFFCGDSIFTTDVLRYLRADAKASAEKIGAFSADKEYSSSDPAIRATKPTISEILIGY